MSFTPDLVIFGGAFDPPHQAHRAMIEALLRHLPEVHVLVVPGQSPAVAGGGGKSPRASFEHRIAMCQELFGTLGARVTVDAIEGTLPTPNYTVNTLRELKHRWPQKQLGLLIGEDQVANFSQWREPNEILKIAGLAVVTRALDAPAIVGPSATAAPDDDLGLDFHLQQLYKTVPQARGRVIEIPHPPLGAAASSGIRAALEQGQLPPADWLPNEIYAYICKHSLYGVNAPI